MECADTLEKLRLDFASHLRLRQAMSEGAEACREIIRRLFYLVTVAAEDASTLAVEGQSGRSSSNQARTSAASLRELGERIEILSSAIMELIDGRGAEDETL